MGFFSALFGAGKSAAKSAARSAVSPKKDYRKSPRDTNGPVVKTGPTAGQNRDRNKDGSWRAKNGSAGKKRT